jgi:hypothetical protein
MLSDSRALRWLRAVGSVMRIWRFQESGGKYAFT